MYFLGSRSTDIWSKHDQVFTVTVHIGLVQFVTEYLDVTTTAVDILFVFNGELDDKVFTVIAEFIEFGRNSVETSILTGLDT